MGDGGIREPRPEDYIVSGLVDFSDISYDEQADLLYDLASQTVAHFRGYLSEDDAVKVLRVHQKEIARFIHAQMQPHYWEEAEGMAVTVTRGFTELKQCAYNAIEGQQVLDYRIAPQGRSNMAKYLFGGFSRCLYAVQKFDSDQERVLAGILERETEK